MRHKQACERIQCVYNAYTIRRQARALRLSLLARDTASLYYIAAIREPFEENVHMRIGHRSWRPFAVIPMLLLALGLSACNVSLSAGNPNGTASSDRAPTTAAGTATAGGRGTCEPQ